MTPWLLALAFGLGYALTALWGRRRRRAVTLWLVLPTVIRKDTSMANFPLLNDEVYAIPILTKDAAGDVVPPPTGDTFTATSSDAASLSVSIGTLSDGTSPAVIATPLKAAATGINITLSDSAGLTSDIEVVDIVGDTVPKTDFLDLAHAQTTPQAVPPS